MPAKSCSFAKTHKLLIPALAKLSFATSAASDIGSVAGLGGDEVVGGAWVPCERFHGCSEGVLAHGEDVG